MKKIIFLIIFLMLPSQAIATQVVPILVYHSIEEFNGHGSKELFVTPQNFERQMRFLKEHGYTLLTFDRFREHDKVPKPIFITFDDGYKNNLNVFSIFKKLDSKNFQPAATIFVISDFIGRENRLSKSELKEMAKSGFFSIQSHTATHPDLTKAAGLEYELKNSKNKIAEITGKPVIALAYPYGNFNDRVVEETKKFYLYGLTTTPGPYIKTGLKNEQFLLPRTYIKYSTTLEDFAKIVK